MNHAATSFFIARARAKELLLVKWIWGRRFYLNRNLGKRVFCSKIRRERSEFGMEAVSAHMTVNHWTMDNYLVWDHACILHRLHQHRPEATWANRNHHPSLLSCLAENYRAAVISLMITVLSCIPPPSFLSKVAKRSSSSRSCGKRMWINCRASPSLSLPIESHLSISPSVHLSHGLTRLAPLIQGEGTCRRLSHPLL